MSGGINRDDSLLDVMACGLY